MFFLLCVGVSRKLPLNSEVYVFSQEFYGFELSKYREVFHAAVQIRAGPAEERGRVCRFNEPSDEVAFLNLRTSGFF